MKKYTVLKKFIISVVAIPVIVLIYEYFIKKTTTKPSTGELYLYS